MIDTTLLPALYCDHGHPREAWEALKAVNAAREAERKAWRAWKAAQEAEQEAFEAWKAALK